MIGIDTNLLVRFFVADDPRQAERARSFFKELESSGQQCFVADVVVLELVWVLESAYEYPREDIARALQALIALPVLKLQSEAALAHVCEDMTTTALDVSDAIIGRLSLCEDCEYVLTFDRRAEKHPMFRLID